MFRLLMLSGTRWMPSMPTSSPLSAFSVSYGVGPVKSTVTVKCSARAVFCLSGLCMLFGLEVRLLCVSLLARFFFLVLGELNPWPRVLPFRELVFE